MKTHRPLATLTAAMLAASLSGAPALAGDGISGHAQQSAAHQIAEAEKQGDTWAEAKAAQDEAHADALDAKAAAALAKGKTGHAAKLSNAADFWHGVSAFLSDLF